VAISPVDSFVDTGVKSKCGSSAVSAPPAHLRVKFRRSCWQETTTAVFVTDAAPKQQCRDVRASVRCNAAAAGGVLREATSLAAIYRVPDDQQLGAQWAFIELARA